MVEQKTLKQYCREAKKRLKQGFWQSYQKNLDDEIERAQNSGIAVSKVNSEIKSVDVDSEEFYVKVKKLLTEEGEVANAIGRLTDKEYYQTLSYEEQQSYNLRLSERYLKAVERYKKEKEIVYNG